MINGYTDRNWEISQYHSNDRYNFPKLQMKEFKRTLNNFKEKIITFFQTSSGSNFGLFLRKLYRIILNLEYELTTTWARMVSGYDANMQPEILSRFFDSRN